MEGQSLRKRFAFPLYLEWVLDYKKTNFSVFGTGYDHSESDGE